MPEDIKPLYERWMLKQRQSLPLFAKVDTAERRVREAFSHWQGEVFVSFSGGLDSTVLLDIVRRMHPDVPAVFANTGLEYPEIVKFVQTKDNVTILRPRKNFRQVISEYGYPVVSKKVSKSIAVLRRAGPKNATHRRLLLTGITKSGRPCRQYLLAQRWRHLVDAPFKISDSCCDWIKKDPIFYYEKQTDRQASLCRLQGKRRKVKRTSVAPIRM